MNRNLTMLVGILLILVLTVTPTKSESSEGNLDGNRQSETRATSSQQTESDQLLIAVQKICPVTGTELDSQGEPVKVQIDEQIVYLCCQGCVGQEVVAEHWATIQNNLAAAQGTCPIMELPVTAEMESVVVSGQRIFVCCPPCIEKIQNDVQASLDKVNANYTAHVEAERLAQSDRAHALAQGICPVSGQTIGANDELVKVQVGEAEVAFLCCQECTNRQINAEHWQTIQNNLAQAQGVCPVMGEPIDSTMESTVVNGRRIFVCCPPCIQAIQQEPQKYIEQLNSQILANQSSD